VPSSPHVVGRYTLYGEIAAGGMATVHYGRLSGPVGFSRTVAIKRLHPQFAKDPEFVSMFLDEARLAARIRHPNVVQTLDVVALEGELFLVMDYVQGESFARLLRASTKKKEPPPIAVVSGILCGVLHGLHAAHEATNEQGEPLDIVHRDVSPQNVLLGADGIPRLLDFGVAKAVGGIHTTREGQIKGKLAYMAPEQLRSGTVDRRSDVFAAGIVLWEALTLRRLFRGESEGAVITSVLEQVIEPPSALVPGVPAGLDAVVMRALDRDRAGRFESARQMALALEAIVPIASPTRVADWVEGLAGEVLAQRAQSVLRIESDSNSQPMPRLPGLPDAERSPATDTAPAATPGPTAAGTKVHGLDASQVSSISVSSSGTHKRVGPGPRHRGTYLALGVGAMVIAAVAFGALRSRSSTPAESVTQSVAQPPPSAAAVAPPAPTEPPAAPAASSSPGPSAVVTPRPVRPRVAPPTSPAAGKPCPIRSYVDADGIMHFVKDCK
jgi:eukaryotic-like serine/threonine-protein kinase